MLEAPSAFFPGNVNTLACAMHALVPVLLFAILVLYFEGVKGNKRVAGNLAMGSIAYTQWISKYCVESNSPATYA